MQQVTINDEGVDNLWSIVSEEIGSGTDSLSAASDTLYKQMKTHLENKLKGKTTQHGHNRDQAPVLVEETTLFGETNLWISCSLHISLSYTVLPPYLTLLLDLKPQFMILQKFIPDLIHDSIKCGHFVPIHTYMSHRIGVQALLLTNESLTEMEQ